MTTVWKCIAKKTVWVIFAISIISHIAYALNPLPGSVAPERTTQNYLSQGSSVPKALPAISSSSSTTKGLGPEAEKIKFKLTKIVLEGNHVYSNQQLESLYKEKLNQTISIAELQKIVQTITNYYRNSGYILSRAVLPPQHVSNGVIHVRIIEGFIDKVKVVGTPRGSKEILQNYGNKIAESRPLQIKDMEYYLLLANQVPGVQAKAVLEPSKTKIGASDLNIVADEQLINASLAYDDYGTLYIGPHQLTGSANINSIARSGDTARATYFTATRDKELRYLDLSYQLPLGLHGLGLTVGGNRSLTRPGFVLTPLETNGRADTYYMSLQYPLILSRSEYLIVDASFTYLNSSVNQFNFLLYDDLIRSLRLGAAYSFADRFKGSNNLAAHLEQGLDIMGASDDPNSLTSSRFGADSVFTKLSAQISRTQALFDSRFSFYLLAEGQYSNKPLLVYEQFGFGGSVIGRGYDPAEILGDRGIAGSAELRMDVYPAKLLQSLQFYTFYDIGKIWNMDPLLGLLPQQSAASAGFGARFSMTKYVSGNIMFTQVLTKDIASEELIGKGKVPKVFFSVVAAV